MPEQYSADQLKTWGRCRRKYYYNSVKKLNWPVDQSRFRFGKSVHKLLEFQSREFDCSHLLADSEPEVQKAWKLLIAHPITRLPLVASEWGFHVPVGGHWLVGRMDRLAREGDQLLIIDWKTGTGVPQVPEVDWQTVVYQFCAVEASEALGFKGLTPERVQFVYVEVKDAIREIRVPYDGEKHALNRERIERTLSEIQQAKEYPLPSQCPDAFCPYRPICGIDSAGEH